MPEFTHRQDRPGAHIRYGEVRFPDGDNLGTGTYSVATDRHALTGNDAVAAVLVNRPVFQLALELNPQTREGVVTFGRADGAEPALQSVYRLPPDAPAGDEMLFVVTFDNWVVQSLTLNGQPLEKIGPMVN
jgi:hypothetical protein